MRKLEMACMWLAAGCFVGGLMGHVAVNLLGWSFYTAAWLLRQRRLEGTR